MVNSIYGTDRTESEINGLFTWNIASQSGDSAPQNIFIVLQDRAQINSQEHSHKIFDKLGVNVMLRINGLQEQYEDILLDFDENQISCVYHHLITFTACDQNVDTSLQILQFDYTTYPMYYFSFQIL